jgi:hypothetical protein
MAVRQAERRLSGPGRFGACFGGLVVKEVTVAAGAGRVTSDAYVDWARPGRIIIIIVIIRKEPHP